MQKHKELVNYANDYKLRHCGHILLWDHTLGTATLKVRFDAGYKDLSVSLYRAVLQLLFNDAVDILSMDIMADSYLHFGFATSSRSPRIHLAKTQHDVSMSTKHVKDVVDANSSHVVAFVSFTQI